MERVAVVSLTSAIVDVTENTNGQLHVFGLKWATSGGNLFLPYANNKDADQPVHPRSLISVFVIRCLDSMMPLVSIFESSSL